ncbi:DUF4242 domain-containing protein [Arenimonas sp.]|uniref:DUF4242 domain-containing protein n=1 Tax=Arenimonas sp. TaxID=1872635 RepID=UPI0039E595E8
MKAHLLVAGLLVISTMTYAVDSSPQNQRHRYLIERNFAKGAIDGLDGKAKARVNSTNARYGVKWLLSYSTADRTRTFCIYDAPSEQAIRDAANANHLPVDAITEVPVTLESH